MLMRARVIAQAGRASCSCSARCSSSAAVRSCTADHGQAQQDLHQDRRRRHDRPRARAAPPEARSARRIASAPSTRPIRSSAWRGSRPARCPRSTALLARIQNDLFDLGSDLATPGADPEAHKPSLRITAAQTDWLEQQIDHYNEGLKPLTSFVLPGGTPLAAALHVARTVVRRAERLVVELIGSASPTSTREAVIYLNRLSDLLFVMARVANANGETDVLWSPASSRETQKQRQLSSANTMFLPLHDRIRSGTSSFPT